LFLSFLSSFFFISFGFLFLFLFLSFLSFCFLFVLCFWFLAFSLLRQGHFFLLAIPSFSFLLDLFLVFEGILLREVFGPTFFSFELFRHTPFRTLCFLFLGFCFVWISFKAPRECIEKGNIASKLFFYFPFSLCWVCLALIQALLLLLSCHACVLKGCQVSFFLFWFCFLVGWWCLITYDHMLGSSS